MVGQTAGRMDGRTKRGVELHSKRLEIKRLRSDRANLVDTFKCSEVIKRWTEHGRIHGRTFADGWAGAVMQKPITIQKCDGRTNGQTA